MRFIIPKLLSTKIWHLIDTIILIEVIRKTQKISILLLHFIVKPKMGMNISSNNFFTTRSYLTIFVGLVPLSRIFLPFNCGVIFYCSFVNQNHDQFLFLILIYIPFLHLKMDLHTTQRKNRLISRSYNIPVSFKLKRKSNIHNTKIVFRI